MRAEAFCCARLAFYPNPRCTAQGELTVASVPEGTTLDPTKYSAGVDQYFIGQMFEQLVRYDPDLKPVNWLAESWKLEEQDGKPVIDVKLRPDVKFHNGDPMTSADFEFCYERLRDPKVSRWSHLQVNVEKFEIVDDLHQDSSALSDSVVYAPLWGSKRSISRKSARRGFC
jgi:peptide/nickel transport system substrate-binding protein